MAIQTAIEWAHSSWNPWRGCHKVSPGCKVCYMFRDQIRYGRDPNVVVRAAQATFRAPLSWARRLATGSRIFTCSWSDWFIEEADEWRPEAWEIIRQTPHFYYLILTKRPERIAGHLPADWGAGWPNVWLGVSAELQREADQRIPLLLAVPAAVRFVSAEPLLGPLDLSEYLSVFKRDDGRWITGLDNPEIQWVITGGESDLKQPRPFDVDWARSIRDQCNAAGVAYFHKQMGGSRKIDGAWGGRVLDGRTWDEFPAEAAKAVADRFDLLELQ